MARPKTKLQQLLAGQTIALEACATRGYNPFIEMINCAQERIALKDGQEPADYGPKWFLDWDYVESAQGRFLVVKRAMRLEVAKAIAPYVAPQLKSTENRTTEDKTITWVIKTFAAPDTSLKVLPPASENGA